MRTHSQGDELLPTTGSTSNSRIQSAQPPEVEAFLPERRPAPETFAPPPLSKRQKFEKELTPPVEHGGVPIQEIAGFPSFTHQYPTPSGPAAPMTDMIIDPDLLQLTPPSSLGTASPGGAVQGNEADSWVVVGSDGAEVDMLGDDSAPAQQEIAQLVHRFELGNKFEKITSIPANTYTNGISNVPFTGLAISIDYPNKRSPSSPGLHVTKEGPLHLRFTGFPNVSDPSILSKGYALIRVLFKTEDNESAISIVERYVLPGKKPSKPVDKKTVGEDVTEKSSFQLYLRPSNGTKDCLWEASSGKLSKDEKAMKDLEIKHMILDAAGIRKVLEFSTLEMSLQVTLFSEDGSILQDASGECSAISNFFTFRKTPDPVAKLPALTAAPTPPSPISPSSPSSPLSLDDVINAYAGMSLESKNAFAASLDTDPIARAFTLRSSDFLSRAGVRAGVDLQQSLPPTAVLLHLLKQPDPEGFRRRLTSVARELARRHSISGLMSAAPRQAKSPSIDGGAGRYENVTKEKFNGNAEADAWLAEMGVNIKTHDIKRRLQNVQTVIGDAKYYTRHVVSVGDVYPGVVWVDSLDVNQVYWLRSQTANPDDKALDWNDHLYPLARFSYMSALSNNECRTVLLQPYFEELSRQTTEFDASLAMREDRFFLIRHTINLDYFLYFMEEEHVDMVRYLERRLRDDDALLAEKYDNFKAFR